MRDFLRRTWAEIDLDRLEHNYDCVRARLDRGCRVMGIVKADAYGHGAAVIAGVLERRGVDYFGVSNIDEAISLRESGIEKPVLILGYTPADFLPLVLEYDFTQTVYSLEQAGLLSETARACGKKARVHVKLDTGMSRLGFMFQGCDDAATVEQIEKVFRLPGLECEGVFTHFAVSDDKKSSFTLIQYERFMAALDMLERRGISFRLRHCCNSAAIINYPQMQLDMVRPGLILYGLYPSAGMEDIGLLPVMELKTAVSQVKKLPPGATVSYGRVYKADREITAATLAIGYADGFPRILSNNSEVLVNGRRASVIGRVCMDQTVVDVSGIDGVREGQTVTVFGREGEEFIPIEELAAKMETINYEIACLIGKRVPRIYKRDGRIAAGRRCVY